MATTPTKPGAERTSPLLAASVPAWPLGSGPHSGHSGHFDGGDSSGNSSSSGGSSNDDAGERPSRLNALQALLAFSALHEQVRRRKALAAQHKAFDAGVLGAEFDAGEQFLLDEVLQLVAERAVAITGADGIAIALADNNEIVLRASAGMVRPDVGARIDRDSAFSGASFRTAQIVNCDDTETDSRVNLTACRRLGARSMVAVPLCGRRRVIGLLEAFSTWPFGFNESDVRNLTLLAELIVSALKPEDEDRFAQSAQIAETKLQPMRPASTVAAKPMETAAAPVVVTAPSVTAPTVPSSVTAPGIPSASVPAANTLLTPLSPIPPKPVHTAPVVSAPVPANPAATPAIPVGPIPAEPAKMQPSGSVATSVPAATSTPASLPAASVPATQVPAAAAPIPAVPIAPKPAAAASIPATPVFPPKTEAEISADKISAGKIEAETREAEKAEKKEDLDGSILDTPAVEAPAITEAAHEPALALGAEPALNSGNRTLILLICIIVVGLAAGVWWKWRASQPSSALVTDKIQEGSTQKSNTTSADASKSSAAPAVAAPAPSPNFASDGLSNEPAPAPATPQELAKFPRVTGVRHWSSADSSTVVLDLEDQVQYEAHRLNGPDRIYFDLHDTQLAPELAGKSIDIGDSLLNRIRVAQPVAGMTRVVLETRGNSNFSVSLEPNPYRLVVEVRKIGASSHGAVNLFPDAEAEKNRLAIMIPPPTKEDLKLRALVPKMRIVVDAGHGGWDLGTVGRRGLLEKDLVLEIAERLGKLLESRLGADVIYTRQDDNYIPLDERAEIANQAQADLFVSVHANYSDLPSARGVETYYTTSFSAPGSKEPGSNQASKDAATLKNVSTPTLSAADLHERIEQSRRLAASVQRALYGTLVVENPGLRDRGIKEAGFVVLTESAMPGILAEVSFVSSPTDEQKLRSDGYREQIAEALYHGIARYAASSKSVKVASASK
jgi:N-acetylmuramoyl-L-alanine amidase/putative methionine-R-sulfoxide reductase with GAF domain